MPRSSHLALGLLLLPMLLSAQSSPTANVGGTPSSAGSVATADQLSYSISVSDSVIDGYYGGGTGNSVNIAGNAAYVSGSERHPTSFIYSGGYLFGNNNQPSTSFQNLGVSQVLSTRNWTFVVGDVVGFAPSTPRYGLAGVPGVGDYGSSAITNGLQPGDAVLSNYGQRLTNSGNVSATYKFDARTSIDLFGGYSLLHFLDGNGGFVGDNGLGNPLLNNGGINNRTISAGSQFNTRLSAATLVGAVYSYSRTIYPAPYSFSFTSNSVQGVYQHNFSQRLSLYTSVGPQWTQGSNAQFFPSRLGVAANASVAYAAGRTNYSLNYTRSTNTGSGVLLGALSDFVNLGAQRTFSRGWSGGASLSYGHTHSLSNVPSLYTSTNSFNTGLQVNRRLAEHWSAFGSYALQYQSLGQISATDNAFNGVAHVFSFGVTYAPRPIHIGRR